MFEYDPKYDTNEATISHSGTDVNNFRTHFVLSSRFTTILATTRAVLTGAAAPTFYKLRQVVYNILSLRVVVV